MRRLATGSALFACVLLAACGGGGGVNSVSSTPGGGSSPTPTPTPAPTPTSSASIASLTTNQSFSDNATSSHLTVSTPDGIVQSGAGTSGTISVRYDAAAATYTVDLGGGASETFGAADIQTPRFGGEVQYKSGTTYLTLVTTPYLSGLGSNRYVGMGYWQRNAVSGSTQTTDFSTFTYGFATDASAVPRAGNAHFTTDIFGLLSTDNVQIRTIQGSGGFDVDFAAGTFSESAFVELHNFITGGGESGALPLTAGGKLSANGFSGIASYHDSSLTLNGTIAGRFYGPAADEVGASFLLSDGTSTLDGAMTGQRAGTPSGVSLVNVPADQRVNADVAESNYVARDGQTDFPGIGAFGPNSGFAYLKAAGPTGVQVNSTTYTPVASDMVSGRSNFTTYQNTTADGTLQRVEYYKVGNANTELALSYVSFADWMTRFSNAPLGKDTSTTVDHILYGIQTPEYLLTGRTGTANYAGVVYGDGASTDGHAYSVTGTSSFAINFSTSSYGGALNLTGTENSGASRNLGSWAFNSTLSVSGLLAQADLGSTGHINPHFYGPEGQEIGATFALSTGPTNVPSSVQIAGVALARKQ